MGALFGFIVGFLAGYFCHQYREKILRVKDKVKKAVDEEF